MNIRTDYVTNSSSSSFIVGFKDERSIESQLSKEVCLVNHFDKVLNDIKNNRISKSKALEDFKDEKHWYAYHAIRDECEGNVFPHFRFYEWIKDPKNEEEFNRKVQEKLDVWFEEFKQKIEDYDYLAEVEYDDHCYSDLEHEIMPMLKCTLERYSHH